MRASQRGRSRPARHAALLALAFTATNASGATYFPLSSGWSWVWEGASGAETEASITGTEVVAGTTTTVLHYTRLQDAAADIDVYFSADVDGALLHHGTRHDDDVEVYVPPIRIIAVDPKTVTSWTTTAAIYRDLDATTTDGDSLRVEVILEGTRALTLAFATWEAIGIRYEESIISSVGARPARRHHVGIFPRGAATEWYVAGLGVATYRTVESYVLASFTQPGVPVRASSWSEIKSLYGVAPASPRPARHLQ